MKIPKMHVHKKEYYLPSYGTINVRIALFEDGYTSSELLVIATGILDYIKKNHFKPECRTWCESYRDIGDPPDEPTDLTIFINAEEQSNEKIAYNIAKKEVRKEREILDSKTVDLGEIFPSSKVVSP